MSAWRTPHTIAGAILVTFVLAGPLDLEATAARPFRATLDGHANPVPTVDPCVLANTEGGSGRAIHMGDLAWTSAETVNFCTNAEGADVEGSFVMTAANGDAVSGRYVTLAHLDFEAGVIIFSGIWQITGGTGRFADATGEGTLTGSGSLLDPFDLTAAFVGTITY